MSNDATTSRTRLCIQPVSASWRIPASTSGQPVCPAVHASSAAGRRATASPRTRGAAARRGCPDPLRARGTRTRATRVGAANGAAPSSPAACTAAQATCRGDSSPHASAAESSLVPRDRRQVVSCCDSRRARSRRTPSAERVRQVRPVAAGRPESAGSARRSGGPASRTAGHRPGRAAEARVQVP